MRSEFIVAHDPSLEFQPVLVNVSLHAGEILNLSLGCAERFSTFNLPDLQGRHGAPVVHGPPSGHICGRVHGLAQKGPARLL